MLISTDACTSFAYFEKKIPKYVEGKQKYWQFCMFILLKSTTSGDKQTWNISLSTNANQNEIDAYTPVFRDEEFVFAVTCSYFYHWRALQTIKYYFDQNFNSYQVFGLEVDNQLA